MKQAFLILFVLVSAAFAQPRYEIVNLDAAGLPPTLNSVARSINNSGQVMGSYWNPSQTESRLFTYSPVTGSVDLGPGPVPIIYPVAINDSGQIVGEGIVPNPARYQVYRYILGDGFTLLREFAEPWGINNRGQIVGGAYFKDAYHAFRYTDGIGFEDLGSLYGGGSEAHAINNQGWVTGSSDGWNIFLYRDDMGMTFLGPGIGWAINDRGAVAGEADVSASSSQAFIYMDGVMRRLGNFRTSSEARGINNSNEVVGMEYNFYIDGFVWSEQDGILNLNSLIPPDSGWNIGGVFDINDAGQIAGYGYYNGKQSAVLLNPVPIVINQQPQSQTVFGGDYATFSVKVWSRAPTFQWFFNGAPVAGATNSTLSFLVNSLAQGGNYTIVISNAASVLTSEGALLTVAGYPPTFRLELRSQVVTREHATELWSYADAVPSAGYQWFFNSSPVTGATNGAFVIESARATNAGSYFVIASNAFGAITSRVAKLDVAPPGPLDGWHWRQSLPQGNDLLAVASGNDRVVAVGRKGAKIVSSDGGRNWTSVGENDTTMNGLTFGNGLFVAAGGAVALREEHPIFALETSTDGVNWSRQNVAHSNLTALTDVAFGNGVFVAVGGRNTVLVSRNGLDWTEHETGFESLGVHHISFASGRFVGFTGIIALSSIDGLVWTAGPFGEVCDAAALNGFEIAVSGLSYYNSDIHEFLGTIGYEDFGPVTLKTWTNQSPRAAITTGRDRFVIVGGDDYGAIFTSGETNEFGVFSWIDHSTNLTDGLFAVHFTGERFVAVGKHGYIVSSDDAESWTPLNTASARNFRAVARGNGRFVAVGNNGYVSVSRAGLKWQAQSVPFTNNLRGVAFGHGRFVAVGDSDPDGSVIYSSLDGSDWVRADVPSEHELYDVVFAHGKFVAVGSGGEVVVSTDGVIWNRQVPATTERLNSITRGRRKFVAVGRHGSIVYSPDGMAWSAANGANGTFWQGVAYGNGVFVAAGLGGDSCLSTNGIDWVAVGTPFREDIEDIVFASGRFVAVGQRGLVGASTDGIHWIRRASGSWNDLRGICYALGRFLTVGNNETILQSEAIR